jgi:RNA polymerase-binding protein DksA
MPARPAAKVAKKAAPKQAKPASRTTKAAKPIPPKPKALKAAPVTRAKGQAKPPTRVAAVKAKEVARPRPRPKQPARRLTAAERAEMRKFREVLLAERARLLTELEEIESRTARTADAERATELSSYEDHPADLASETFEREKDLAIAESVESLFNQVNTALEKVDHGTYGICDACGRPIKKARLQALPFATLCLDCQGRLEG